MIWLALRRHRTNLLIVLGLLLALGVWMAAVAWQIHTAPVVRSYTLPGYGVVRARQYTYGPALFRLTWQVTEINVVLLAVPCVLGALLGAPLVAGEYDDRTNRLAWTQGIGRTRWYLTKWMAVGIPLLVVVIALAFGTHLWSFHVLGATQAGGNWGSFSNGGRMQPGVFPASGVVPVAYTLFAFALGTALGAVVRRTTWAVVGTVLLYGLALLVMTTTVRPVLAPQLTVPQQEGNPGPAIGRLLYGAGYGTPSASDGQPWFLGSDYVFTPGYHPPAGTPSPDTIVSRCAATATGNASLACIIGAHLVYADTYQPRANYWRLQWREAAIYLFASLLLVAVGWWAVRRWRA